MLADLFYEEGDEQNGSISANDANGINYVGAKKGNVEIGNIYAQLPKPPEPRGSSGFVGLENQ